MTRWLRRDSATIPLLEVSALATRRGSPGTGIELLAVADASWAVAATAFQLTGALQRAATDLKAPVAASGLPTPQSSEFEGVASDAGGRVFVLQEGPARVLVFDAAMAVLHHTLDLHVAADTPDIGAGWTERPNARGEGLLLLKNGHMLVAKQREPVRLIEFGPAADLPLGYGPASALSDGEAFALAAGGASRLEVLATWALDSALPVESINDLAAGPDGRLHFVSSRSRCVGWLEADLRPGADVVAASAVALPAELFAGDDDKAEGLAFVDALGWLVALDLQRAAPNLHQLELISG